MTVPTTPTYAREDAYAAFTVTYTGTATVCVISITSTTLKTWEDGTLDLSLDLTNASYDTISEVVAAIEADANYTCTRVVGDGTIASSDLRRITRQTLTVNVATTIYGGRTDLSSFLGRSFTDRFKEDDQTNPQTVVEDMFLRAEARIDRETHTSWRLNTEVDRIIDYDDEEMYGFLNLSMFTPLRAVSSLKIWESTDWSAAKTEGYSNDYYLHLGDNMRDAKVEWRSSTPPSQLGAVKMSFTWGHSSVPDDIKKATLLLAAIEIVENDEYRHVLSGSTDSQGETPSDRTGSWKAEYEKIISKHARTITFP